jgi:hypothetical protein
MGSKIPIKTGINYKDNLVGNNRNH